MSVQISLNDHLVWDLTSRQYQDTAAILEGTLAPLVGFMNQGDYESVVRRGRMANGTLWPLPYVLEVSSAFAEGLRAGSVVKLRDEEGATAATMQVEEIWRRHCGSSGANICLAGPLTVAGFPGRFDFAPLRRRLLNLVRLARIRHSGTAIVVDQVLHRAQVAALTQALGSSEDIAVVVLDDYESSAPVPLPCRVRCVRHALARVASSSTELLVSSVCAVSNNWQGMLLKAILSRNVGCTSCMILLPSKDDRVPFEQAPLGFRSWDELSNTCREELGIELKAAYVNQAAENQVDPIAILYSGARFPEDYSFPEVIEELRRTCVPKKGRGFTIFFTGLSGAGKSTLARAFQARLLESGGRTASLLDGDIVRKNLSSELGFSREHRDLNVLRIGYVASEVTKHGGIAICTPIAPYAQARAQVRKMVSRYGGFIEVYVSTPLEACEARDRKGLYAKARSGSIKGFTGISDPYEPPRGAEVTIDTRTTAPDLAVEQIVKQIEAMGYSLDG
jgi:sulfate adenylyltransferase